MQQSRASKTIHSRQSEEFFYELPKQKQKKQSLDETRQIYKNILGQKDPETIQIFIVNINSEVSYRTYCYLIQKKGKY